jgi:hypothetical protein
MSRIDISVKDKASEELIANRGFCRSSHLSCFCENAPDDRVRKLANDLFIGIDITEDNIKDFVATIRCTISYLERIGQADREKQFSDYSETAYFQFLEDLREGITFIQAFDQEQKLSNLEIEIA